MIKLTAMQRSSLGQWRKQALASGGLLDRRQIDEIQTEISCWPTVGQLHPRHKFFERFALLDKDGARTDLHAWRGVCHWLGLRHGCVHAMGFSPSRMAILQRRSKSVWDSPDFLDMTLAGHMADQDCATALRMEASEEASLDFGPDSKHVVDSADLQPFFHYEHIERTRPNEEFFNVEVRFVYAIRLSSEALGSLYPGDGEVASFILAPMAETRSLMSGTGVASALKASGPHALQHAVTLWGW